MAVKALSLRTMADWKQLELFEKEADALRRLSHPGIPAYKDYFEVDSDGDRAYFLVQVSKAYTSACVHSTHHNIHICCCQAVQRHAALLTNTDQMPSRAMLYECRKKCHAVSCTFLPAHL